MWVSRPVCPDDEVNMPEVLEVGPKTSGAKYLYFWLKTQIGFVQFSSQHFVNYISIWSVKLLAPMDYDHIFSLTLLFQSPMASKVLFSSASLPSFSPPPNLPNHFSQFTTLLLPHLDAPCLPYSGLLVLLPIEGGGPGGGQVGQPGSPLLQLLLLCGLPSLLDQGQQVCHLCTRAALGFNTTSEKYCGKQLSGAPCRSTGEQGGR